MAKDHGIIAHLVRYHLASIEARYALAKAWGAVCEVSKSPQGLLSKNTGQVGAKLSEAMARVRNEHEDEIQKQAEAQFEERRKHKLNPDMLIGDNRYVTNFGKTKAKRFKSILRRA